MRNYLTPGFMDFSLLFTTVINLYRSNSYLPSAELRADVSIVCSDLSKKLAAFRTTSSKSLTLVISLSKIMQNMLIILSSKVLAIQYRDFNAVIRTLFQLSSKLSRIARTIGSENLAVPSGKFLSPLMREGITSSPAILRLRSWDLRYFYLKKMMILSIWFRCFLSAFLQTMISMSLQAVSRFYSFLRMAHELLIDQVFEYVRWQLELSRLHHYYLRDYILYRTTTLSITPSSIIIYILGLIVNIQQSMAHIQQQIYAHIEHLQKIAVLTSQTVYLKLTSVPLPNENNHVWALHRLVDSRYYHHIKIQQINTEEHLFGTLNKASNNSGKLQLIISANILKQLVQNKVILTGRYEEINEALFQLISVQLQLPSVITPQDQVQLQLLGYRFDPNQRLINQKLSPVIYTPQNIQQILPVIKEQTKLAYKFYDNKDWKNSNMFIDPICFEIEVKVKIIGMKNASFQTKPLTAPLISRSTLVHLSISGTSEQSLNKVINNAADILLSKQANQSSDICYAPQKIYNPHIFIKTTYKNMYLQYFTKGLYEYYHYGDQSFNDQGWGCAYRSLQTLLSWLNIQNYCKLPKMLTIPQIQQTIDRINLGSKDKLRNTRQWIGATEVSWIVKKFTNFDCRIVHISDGKDIIQNCEVFRQHFEKVGCPIMYGGGQYAYSIVGINYSWKLGQCEFLILDPHYTGADSIDKILQKKGLAWRKPEDMFKKGIFYNFCLPLI